MYAIEIIYIYDLINNIIFFWKEFLYLILIKNNIIKYLFFIIFNKFIFIIIIIDFDK